MQALTIGGLAKAAGVGVETIRFYEREGLVPQPPQPAGGYRRYSAELVRRVQFIRRAKDLGFTLAEVLELLSLRVDRERTCAEVRAIAQAKIADIQTRLADLQRMKLALEDLAGACHGKGAALSECPILAALDAREAPHGHG